MKSDLIQNTVTSSASSKIDKTNPIVHSKYSAFADDHQIRTRPFLNVYSALICFSFDAYPKEIAEYINLVSLIEAVDNKGARHSTRILLKVGIWEESTEWESDL